MAIFARIVVACMLAISVCAQNVPYYETNKISYIGRTYPAPSNGGIIFSWSGVTVSARISNTNYFSVFLSGALVYFDVKVDGNTLSPIYVSNYGTMTEYVVSTQLPLSAHNVSITRRDEASFGPSTFFGFSLSSGGSLLQPPARPSRRIEFIGDSITCGYGNLGVFPCSFSASTENVVQSHGPLTAAALGAEYFVAAWGGMGMVRNYGDGAASANPFPSYYPYTVGGQQSYGTWNFQQWAPQAVVINLGTNDYSTYPQPSQAAYTNAYTAFINTIKSNYAPSVPQFFLVCGPMAQDYCPYIEQLASSIGATYINLWGLNTQPYGCDYHPSVAVQTNMASVQTGIISSVMNWNTANTFATNIAAATSNTIGSGSSTTSGGSSSEVIFGDQLGALWQSWSWATNSLTNTNPTYGGSSYSISFTLNSYQALYFHRTQAFLPSSFDLFNFQLNCGSTANVPLAVTFFDASSQPTTLGQQVFMSADCPSNQWVPRSVPISSFALPAGAYASGITISYASGDTPNTVVYVDTVQFLGASSSTTVSSSSTSSTLSSTGSRTSSTSGSVTVASTASSSTVGQATTSTKATSATTKTTATSTSSVSVSKASTTTKAASIAVTSTSSASVSASNKASQVATSSSSSTIGASTANAAAQIAASSSSTSAVAASTNAVVSSSSTSIAVASTTNLVASSSSTSQAATTGATSATTTVTKATIATTATKATTTTKATTGKATSSTKASTQATTIASTIATSTSQVSSTTTSATVATTVAASTSSSSSLSTTTGPAADCVSVCDAACIAVSYGFTNQWDNGTTTVVQDQFKIDNLCTTKTLVALSWTASNWNPIMSWNLNVTGNIVALPSYAPIAIGGSYTTAGFQNAGGQPTFIIASFQFQ